MRTNTAERYSCQRSTRDEDKAAVERALNNWRQQILTWLGEELRQAGQERMEAADGLGIAHRNPRLVVGGITELLWSDLETACIKQARLERVISAIEQMDFPEMLILFSRTTKLKTWPWEGNRWELPDWKF